MSQHEKGETCLSLQRRGINLYYIDINIRVPYLVFIDVTAFWLGPRNFNNRLITEVNELYIEKWSMSILIRTLILIEVSLIYYKEDIILFFFHFDLHF